MQHDEFIGQVQARARLGSRGDAERATRATLETLAERLAGGAPENLAAQLPAELARHLEGHPEPEKLDLDGFFQRVSEKGGSDLPQAVQEARAVIAVVSEAVSAGEMDKIRQQFPADFDPLFEAGSEGRMETG